MDRLVVTVELGVERSTSVIAREELTDYLLELLERAVPDRITVVSRSPLHSTDFDSVRSRATAAKLAITITQEEDAHGTPARLEAPESATQADAL